MRLEQAKWTEAVFSDMKSDTGELPAIACWAQNNGWLVRSIRKDTSYGVDVSSGYENYLGGLGKSTRLKLFNRRKVFESLGSVIEENFWPERTTEFFELLNQFHRVRWGTPCFSERSISFHRDFLNCAASEGIKPYLMVLHIGLRPVSVLYNVLYDGCVYNIQSGYEQAFHKKVALGTLHLGYAIEAAFKDPEVSYFDLLAGEGKNTDYKAHLATDRVSLISIMVVRSRVFRLLYRAKDFLHRVKQRTLA